MIIGKRPKKRTRCRLGFVIVMAIICMMFVPAEVQAAGIDFNAKIVELKAKFPHEKYWNHVGSTTDNPDGYTDKPCTLHNTSGVDHVYGTGGCTCNHFACNGRLSAAQCMGFANKLGYEVFGETAWTLYNNPSSAQLANIQVGDIVRINGHSVFVIARTGNDITVGEANYPNGCQISWGRIINLTKVTVNYYEHANNYATVLGSATVTPGGSGSSGEATTETPPEQATTEMEDSFTGWKQTSAGQYQYFKEGKLQKKQWLTLKKKKYYLDKKGYRVTGLYEIGKETYYFNNKGVLQKTKWVTVDHETYYVGNAGSVLKKQWLYYKNTLVYVTDDGSMAKDELVEINGKTYYFNAKGKRSKGFKKVNGKYYYSDSSGIIQKKQWFTKSGKTYYLQKNGVRVQSKLVKIGSYRYYFNEKGYLVKNKWFTYKGDRYHAEKDGRCKMVKNESEDDLENAPN